MESAFDKETMRQFENILVDALYNSYAIKKSQKYPQVQRLLDNTIDRLNEVQQNRDKAISDSKHVR